MKKSLIYSERNTKTWSSCLGRLSEVCVAWPTVTAQHLTSTMWTENLLLQKKNQQTKQTGFGNNWLESAYYRLQLSFLWLRAWIFQPLCVLSKRNQTLTHSVPVSTELSELKWMWMLSLTVNIWLYHMSWQTEAVGQRQWLSAWNQAVGSRQLFWKFIQ